MARAWGFPEAAKLLGPTVRLDDGSTSGDAAPAAKEDEPVLPEGAIPLFPRAAARAQEEPQPGASSAPKKMTMPTQLQPEKLEL